MKAAVYDRYGPPDVVEIRDVPKPTPKPGEILIRVRAATVAAGDWRLRRPSPFLARLFNGLFRPKKVHVLGFELSGEVEAVGAGVSRFETGDSVFAFTGFGFGAHAEYRCVQESGRKPQRDGMVARKPANLSHEEAAATPVGALTAQYFLRKSGLTRGQSVLIYGASGSVGTFAIQIAKALGAEVTGVCSTANLELVRGLGADHVIDYSKEEIAASGRVYDVVFDAVGKLPSSSARSVLARGGKRESVRNSAKLEPGDLDLLKDLIEAGKLLPVIDRRFSLEEIVRAHEYVEAGHKKGNVVITMPTASESSHPRSG
ncbi:MAG TPA: NAD(P)-dependent alcohol dehydrogenase [Gemmatimonadaceae bacterium]|nr:NAD(P)-dependent alcohol dehydrogenase [Gemmatimonadaceae bacterium]